MKETYARPWMPSQSRAEAMRALLAKDDETRRTRATWRQRLAAWIRRNRRAA